MFDFERLFICRNFRVAQSGISAEGIGFKHSAEVSRLLVFGHVLTPSAARPFRYTVRIEGGTEASMGVIGSWPYTLVPAVRADRRILLGWFPVSGMLAPGFYEVIIEIERQHATRTGLEIS